MLQALVRPRVPSSGPDDAVRSGRAQPQDCSAVLAAEDLHQGDQLPFRHDDRVQFLLAVRTDRLDVLFFHLNHLASPSTERLFERRGIPRTLRILVR
jgi:hypothetical protein